MKHSQVPQSAPSQFRTLRSWFFWSIGGVALCCIFWVVKLDGKSVQTDIRTQAAAVEVNVISSPMKVQRDRKSSSREKSSSNQDQ